MNSRNGKKLVSELPSPIAKTIVYSSKEITTFARKISLQPNYSIWSILLSTVETCIDASRSSCALKSYFLANNCINWNEQQRVAFRFYVLNFHFIRRTNWNVSRFTCTHRPRNMTIHFRPALALLQLDAISFPHEIDRCNRCNHNGWSSAFRPFLWKISTFFVRIPNPHENNAPIFLAFLIRRVEKPYFTCIKQNNHSFEWN